MQDVDQEDILECLSDIEASLPIGALDSDNEEESEEDEDNFIKKREHATKTKAIKKEKKVAVVCSQDSKESRERSGRIGHKLALIGEASIRPMDLIEEVKNSSAFGE